MNPPTHDPFHAAFAFAARLRLPLLAIAISSYGLEWISSTNLDGWTILAGHRWITPREHLDMWLPWPGILLLLLSCARALRPWRERATAEDAHRAWTVMSMWEWAGLLFWGFGLADLDGLGRQNHKAGFVISKLAFLACLAITVFAAPNRLVPELCRAQPSASDPVREVFLRVARSWRVCLLLALPSYFVPWTHKTPPLISFLLGPGDDPVEWGTLYGALIVACGCTWTLQRGRWYLPRRLSHVEVISTWAAANAMQMAGLLFWGLSLAGNYRWILVNSGRAMNAGAFLVGCMFMTTVTPFLLYRALRARGAEELREDLCKRPGVSS